MVRVQLVDATDEFIGRHLIAGQGDNGSSNDGHDVSKAVGSQRKKEALTTSGPVIGRPNDVAVAAG
jgi:hypothetical protein